MNRATKTNLATMDVILAIAGLDHGVLEILQGNQPTSGPIVQAIGPDHVIWQNGTEKAFTLPPPFLFTGLLAVAVSLALAVWSVWFVHRNHRVTVLGLLLVALFLLGGGLGACLVTFVSGFARAIEQAVVVMRRQTAIP